MKRIYINDAVHEELKRESRRQGRTLRWVVEQKLTGVNEGTPNKTPPPQNKYKPSTLETKGVEDLIKETKNTVNTPLEMDCCPNDNRPCKHWVWDVEGGEGHVNTLSGRLREIE